MFTVPIASPESSVDTTEDVNIEVTNIRKNKNSGIVGNDYHNLVSKTGGNKPRDRNESENDIIDCGTGKLEVENIEEHQTKLFGLFETDKIMKGVKKNNLLDDLKQLISISGDNNILRTRNLNGETVLHICSRLGLEEVTEALIHPPFTMDPFAVDNVQQTPVDVAGTDRTFLAFVEKFAKDLRQWAKTNDVYNFKRVSKLLCCHGRRKLPRVFKVKLFHLSSLYGSVDCVNFLLTDSDLCVPVDSSTMSKGRTALHYSVLSGHYAVVRLLLKFGADPLRRDKEGRNALTMVNNSLIQGLLEKGLQLFSFGTIDTEDHLFKLKGESYDRCSARKKRSLNRFLSSLCTPNNLVNAICLLGFSANIFTESTAGSASVASPKAKSMSLKMFMLPSLKSRKTIVLDSFPTTLKQWNATSVSPTEEKSESFRDTMSYGVNSVKLMPEINRCCRESAQYFIERQFNTPVFLVFVLTNESGQRSYCYVLTFPSSAVFDQHSEKCDSFPTSIPKCVCLVSRFALYSLFKTILFDMYNVALWSHKKEDYRSVESHLYSIETFTKEMMVPNLCRLEAPWSIKSRATIIDTGVRSMALFSPPKLSLPLVDEECFNVLLQCLSPESIVALISSLLSEQSILIVTEYPELTFPIAEALISLIFPFEWVHVYVPLLSKETIEVVHAPFPFLVGIQSKYLHLIDGEKLASLTLVNIDRDSVVHPIQPDTLISFKQDRYKDSEFIGGNERSNTRLKRNQSQYEQQHPFVNLPEEIQENFVSQLSNISGEARLRTDSEDSFLPVEVSRDDLKFTDISVKPLTRKQDAPERAKIIANALVTTNENGALASSNLEVKQLRKLCVKLMLDLVASYSLFDYDRNSHLAFIESQKESRQSFLTMLLHTQLWSCFHDDITGNGTNFEREICLTFFRDVVNISLKLERVEISAEKIQLYQSPKLDAEEVGCLYKGDIATIALKKKLSDLNVAKTSLIWFKVRDMNGWCLANPVQDFLVLQQLDLDDFLDASAHRESSEIYPYENQMRVF